MSVTDGRPDWRTRTSVAAWLAASRVDATTTATGCPKNSTSRVSKGIVTPRKSVSTRSTSRSRSASSTSTPSTRPLETLLVTSTAYTRSGTALSAAYNACPVTLRRPSTRGTGWPVEGSAVGNVMAAPRPS